MKKNGISNAVYYVLSQGMSAVASFLLLAIFSRYLSTSEYGNYSIYVAIFTIVVVFIGLNTHISIVRRSCEVDSDLKGYISSLISLQGISILVLSVLSIILFKWTLVSMSIITAGLLSLSYIYFEYVRALGRAKEFFILNSCRQLGVIIFAIYFLYRGYGFESGVYANIVVLTLLNVYYLMKLKVKPSFGKENIKYALLFSVPLIPFALGNVSLSYVDRFVVYEMLGSAETGQISFMSNYSNLFLLIIQAITLGWQPRVFEYIKSNNKEDIEKNIKMIFAFLTFVAIGMIMLSKEFTLLIGSSQYASVYRYITPLIAGNLLYFIYIFYTDFTIYYKSNNHLTVYVFLAVVLKIFLSIVIARLLPFQYINFTSLIIFFVLLVLQYRYSCRRFSIVPPITIFFKYLVIFLVSAFSYEIVNHMDFSNLLSFVIRVGLVLMMGAILGYTLKNDVKDNNK